MTKHDFTLIIFDCDGVLIDSEAVYLETEFAFLAQKGIHVDRDWYVGEFMALAAPLWKEKFSDLIEAHTGSALSDAAYDDFKHESRAAVMEKLTTIDGIETLLDALDVPQMKVFVA